MTTAFATRSVLSRSLSKNRFQVVLQRSALTQRSGCRRPVSMSAANPKLEAWVKGDPNTNTLGDCPFCHRVLLTLEEKSVPYLQKYVDFADKPKWLLDVNPSGSVPVVKDLEENKWVVDSGTIVDYLEGKFPEPALGTSESIPDAGAGIFGAFVKFFTSPPEEEADKKAALEVELKAFSDFLADGKAFIGGDSFSAADAALGPKLHHATVALKHYKGYDIVASYPAVAAYLERVKARPSWQHTAYGDELVLKGWGAKLQK